MQPVIKWASNQRCEAIITSGKIAFWVRGQDNTPLLGGTLDTEMASDDNRMRAMLEGFKKRVNDACAGAKTRADMQEIITRLCDHYNNGGAEWNVRVAVRALDRACMFVAIATVRNLSAEHVESRLRDKTDEMLRSYNGIPEIAAEYARLTTAKRPAVDEAALFADLDA